MVSTAGAGVTIDASAAPEQREWAEKAAPIAQAWLPRLANLLAVPGARTPADIRVTVTPDYKGVAYASGDRITMAAAWVRDHPEDAVGALIHELVHVIQGYPGGSEHWLTEGIADFVRFSIYEGKPASYFPKPGKPQGYRDAYQVAAGFLAWLEAGPAPGIVRRLHAALRARKYDPQLFETAAGKPLDELWREYTADAGSARLPASLTKLSFGLCRVESGWRPRMAGSTRGSAKSPAPPMPSNFTIPEGASACASRAMPSSSSGAVNSPLSTPRNGRQNRPSNLDKRSGPAPKLTDSLPCPELPSSTSSD
jgi:hypothetical protein